MKILLSTFFLIIFYSLSAQKPVIDFDACDSWPTVYHSAISADGHFASYVINNRPMGSSTTVVTSLQRNWRQEFTGIRFRSEGFTPDARFFFVLGQNDSLMLLSLETDSVRWLPHVSSCFFYRLAGESWLAYLCHEVAPALVLEDLNTHRHHRYEGVTACYPDTVAHLVVLQSQTNAAHIQGVTLAALNLKDLSQQVIWSGYRATEITFDRGGLSMVFRAEEMADTTVRSYLRYYRLGEQASVKLADCDDLDGLDSFRIDAVLQFNHIGDRLYISLARKKPVKSMKEPPAVDLWSYQDAALKTPQAFARRWNRSYKAVICVQSRRVIRLEGDNETILDFDRIPGQSNDDIVAVCQNQGDLAGEWHWNRQTYAACYLVSTTDGSRRAVVMDPTLTGIRYYTLSPSGRYVIYYDPRVKTYYSYTIGTGKTYPISSGMGAEWTSWEQADYPKRNISRGPAEVIGWLAEDSGALICDRYDVWVLDPSGAKPPRSITQRYGRLHNIIFRPATGQEKFATGDQLLLRAFDRKSRNDGFFMTKLGGSADPHLLTMQPCVFTGSEEGYVPDMELPVKAADTGVFIVRRMTETTSPNFYWTADFKHFSAISSLRPELAYNWLSSELMTWKRSDGTTGTGILYKPENFDPTIKYPLIIHYYEKVSANCHVYLAPDYCNSAINIPWMVSRGYLVFTPDIDYRVGHPGQGVVNTVVSAAQFLGRLPFVKPSKIGIQGHSRGGFETNFLLTHSHVFAAAVSACGMVDYVSLSLQINQFGNGRGNSCENGPQRIGATLWERPDLYIENSPVFQANRVTTPVLIMANKEDLDVPYSQGLAFFLALRRLGKPAWLLQYDNEGHTLIESNDKRDFTNRMTEFFGYYLKGSVPPSWLTGGTPTGSASITQ